MMTARRPLYLVGCISIVLAIAYGTGAAVQREPQDLPLQNQPSVNFEDKVVVLDISGGIGMNSEAESLILENARVLKLGNRDFIVGDALPYDDDSADFHKDVTAGAPCDNVLTVRTMTRERFKTYLEKWKDEADEQ